MSRPPKRIDPPTPKDFLKCFSTPEGQRILAHLRKMYVLTDCYVKGDTHDTANRLGAKRVVLSISRQIEIARKKPIGETEEEEVTDA